MSDHLARIAEEAHFLESVSRFDEVEKMILLRGMRAMVDDGIGIDQFKEKYGSLIERYRAGEELTLADLGIA